MVRLLTGISILLPCLIPLMVAAAQEISDNSGSQVIFTSPHPGQALQGTILIIGEIIPEDAQKLELSFSYADDPRNTWFLIHEIEENIPQEFSMEWDTNALTDGQYTIRAVLTTTGEQYISTVPGLRVRNYSVIETSTPFPTATPASEETIAPTATLIMKVTPIPDTATPPPTNPAQINNRDLGLSLGKGAAVTFGIFGIFGLYHYLRNRSRKADR